MTIRSNKLAAWAAAAVFALLTPLAQANLVANGGFETGDFTAWTQFGDTSNDGVVAGIQHSGVFGAAFGSTDPAGSGISQFISTGTEGYTVRFWLQQDDSGTPTSFSWSWNGVEQLAFADGPGFDYTEFSAVVQGNGGLSELRFTFYNEPGFFLLDDVAVIPEPGTLALMSLALLAGGVVRRRKG